MNKTDETIVINKTKKLIYKKNDSKTKYVKHNKNYIPLTDYKNQIKHNGGGTADLQYDIQKEQERKIEEGRRRTQAKIEEEKKDKIHKQKKLV